MLKKILPVVIAGQLMNLNFSTEAQATVSLNPQGIGQVLIYPYYTVNNNMNTLITVVNTTDKVKAVRMNFMEGKNNRDTLNFIIYLAPYDTWTGALVAASSTVPEYQGQPSVKLISNDNTCTVPILLENGVQFRPYGYANGDGTDPIDTNMSRVTEGYFQVIEMGELEGDFAQFAMFENETPKNCSALVNNWQSEQVWTVSPNEGLVAPDGSGGLYGSASLIDVASGFDVTYNATAIQGYSTVIQHEMPGTILPNLGSGNITESTITTYTGTINTEWDSPFKAISAVLMANEYYADFNSASGIGAATEVVMTFPTKQFYVDALYSPTQIPLTPFTGAVSENGACEDVGVALLNRESHYDLTQTNFALCWGVNTIEFNTQSLTNKSTILGSQNNKRISTDFESGQTKFAFSQSVSSSAHTFNGLPVVGFTVQRYVNGNISGGLLANYGGLFPLISNSRVIELNK